MDNEVTNATEKDDPLDQALLDLFPTIPDSSDSSSINPDDPFSLF